jgi:hypothetical protein
MNTPAVKATPPVLGIAARALAQAHEHLADRDVERMIVGLECAIAKLRANPLAPMPGVRSPYAWQVRVKDPTRAHAFREVGEARARWAECQSISRAHAEWRDVTTADERCHTCERLARQA